MANVITRTGRQKTKTKNKSYVTAFHNTSLAGQVPREDPEKKKSAAPFCQRSPAPQTLTRSICDI
jgi:hypothetical protein